MFNDRFLAGFLCFAVITGLTMRSGFAAEPREQTAVFSEGCFWNVEALFRHVKGVTDVESGYTGGSAVTARYELISLGNTGHAEAVRVHFDPSRVSYTELLRVFFTAVHDPAKQGRPGTGPDGQYRSAIFFADSEQQGAAQAYLRQLNEDKSQKVPVTTQVVPLLHFYRAEEYQQNHLGRQHFLPYGTAEDVPQISRLQRMAPDLYLPAD